MKNTEKPTLALVRGKTVIAHVDLVMWTKNGAETLDLVLAQIGKVIPEEFVKSRIIVDDHSTDNTLEIAKSHGWTTVLLEEEGISEGANLALKSVKTEYFISFEQDLLLATDWWEKIPPLLQNDHVAVASGIRLSNKPLAAKKLEEYECEQSKNRQDPADFFGRTLDNTIYKTEIIRRVDGFPKLPPKHAGIDQLLNKELSRHGYSWKVNYGVISTHLRRGLIDELKHQYWYGKYQSELTRKLSNGLPSRFLAFATIATAITPMRGLGVAYRQRCWQIVIFCPLIRLAFQFGLFAGSKENTFNKS